eukprot:comp17744_c0_seq1/m.17726 comp17744_c0_seq1/g.17726  ORF comp17744_c0_seq1/g.17726 comp17744_c0_seq1/m.17726 type:complete len:236 (-) comp17744_c0_seq1:688-1395(-)
MRRVAGWPVCAGERQFCQARHFSHRVTMSTIKKRTHEGEGEGEAVKKQRHTPAVKRGWSAPAPSLIVHTPTEGRVGPKVAAFDLDDTLVTTKSGRKSYMRTGPTDWKWFLPAVPAKLQQLHKEGYSLCIFSNQSTIKSKVDGASATKVKGVVDGLLKDAGVPAHVIMATQKDDYRKPSTGMWRWMTSHCCDGDIDMASSFFVGDAAGGPKDHSDSDRRFAEAVGVKFFTPQEYFK